MIKYFRIGTTSILHLYFQLIQYNVMTCILRVTFGHNTTTTATISTILGCTKVARMPVDGVVCHLLQSVMKAVVIRIVVTGKEFSLVRHAVLGKAVVKAVMTVKKGWFVTQNYVQFMVGNIIF